MWDEHRPFQSLALTGGGYKGLFTASVLETVEQSIGKPIGQCFDLACGTSIGGIVALAVAFEVPMKDVVKVFQEEGETIFPPHKPPTSWLSKANDLWKHRAKPRYSSDALRRAITRLIDKDALMADARHPVAIPAVNVTSGRPQVFKTRHLSAWNRDLHFRAVDVALATSAAPTFFPLAEVDGSRYADGGLFANAPDLLAVHEAEHFFNVPSGSQRLLSVGTTTRAYSISMAAGSNLGVADWMEEQRLFSVMISSQQQFVDQLMRHRLGARYCRIDHAPGQEQAGDLGLDRADEAARQTLVALGRKVASDMLGTELKPFIGHEPLLKIIRG